MKKIALGAAMVLVVSAGCARNDALAEMELRARHGEVQVVRDGEVEIVTGTFGLQPGDLVVTKRDALATFALEGGDSMRTVELQSNSAVLVKTTTAIEAREGNVLVRAAADTTAIFDEVRATTSKGIFRIDRGFGAARAATYSGRAQLRSTGQPSLALPSYYQATVVAGDIPTEAKPYRIDARDAWDQQLLEDVLNLESRLEELSRGLTNQLSSSRPGLPYFSELAPSLDVSFMEPYLSRKPADLLVAFIIASNAEGDMKSNFREAFDLHDSGARWGIVAKILGAQPNKVLSQLGRLILGTGAVTAQGRGRGADFTVAAAEASQDSGGNNQGPGTQGPGSGPGDDGDDGGEDPREPKDEPKECSDGPDCTIQEISDELQPSPEPSPTNDDDEPEDSRLLEGALDG